MDKTNKRIAKALLVAAVCTALTGCYAFKGRNDTSKIEPEDRPNCPITTTRYKGFDGCISATRLYDCTTGHTWWILDTGNPNQPYLVLDTAGTQAIG